MSVPDDITPHVMDNWLKNPVTAWLLDQAQQRRRVLLEGSVNASLDTARRIRDGDSETELRTFMQCLPNLYAALCPTRPPCSLLEQKPAF